MPLIAEIGKRHARVRLLREIIFAALMLGSLAMLVPFLLMAGGSLRSGVDQRESAWWPSFLRDDTMLWRKHIESLFDERLDALRSAYDEDVPSFDRLTPPVEIPTGYVAAWREFLAEFQPDTTYYALGHLYAPITRAQPRHLRGFKEVLARRYGTIEVLNRELEVDFASWTGFVMPTEDLLPRRTRPGHGALDIAFAGYKREQPDYWRVYYCVDGYFRSLFLKARYGRDIEGFNAAHGTAYRHYSEVPLSRRAPVDTPNLCADWELFVRRSLNLLWIRLDPAAAPDWRRFLAARYPRVDLLNERHGTNWRSFEDAVLPVTMPASGAALADWEVFITGWRDPASGIEYGARLEHLELCDIGFAFRDWLAKRYGDLPDINHAVGTAFRTEYEIRPPQKAAHYEDVQQHVAELRREFLWRNYATVLDYLLHHGRGLWNTVVYCGCAVLCALIFNPLAAYALSRYRPASTYRLLLFFLLTMAFPPMVTQIPAFLLMRDLGLLNSFWALILPGLASGYSIFLLKGFFDSLPRELYEQAQIDGAGEWTLFWRLTMSLSKPILAVTALHAFTAAYANFMFALLICQDQRMWTLMVWLYQLQQRSGPGVMYASLMLAALPTLLIFLFCQKMILRGIVVPSEK